MSPRCKSRRERDQRAADTGAVTSAKDLEGLQREVVSLDRRIATLEDAELEVMERLEAAQAERDGHERERAPCRRRVASPSRAATRSRARSRPR